MLCGKSAGVLTDPRDRVPVNVVTYRSDKNMVFSCKYHVIWWPKHRRLFLRGPFAKRLEFLVEQFVGAMRSDLLDLEVSATMYIC